MNSTNLGGKVAELFSSNTTRHKRGGWERTARDSRRKGQIQQTPEIREPQTGHGSDKGYKNPILEAQMKSSGGCAVKTPSASSFKESQSSLIKAI